MELKFKFIYIHKGREMDLVSRGVKAVKVKNKNAASSKLEKEMEGQLTKIGTYKSRATIKRTIKNI